MKLGRVLFGMGLTYLVLAMMLLAMNLAIDDLTVLPFNFGFVPLAIVLFIMSGFYEW